MILRIAWLVLALLVFEPAGAQAGPTIRVGLLRFGTVAWEIDTIRHFGLDLAHGITVAPVEFASNESAKVALLAGAVDLIVTDWPWVARQRGEGEAFSFVSYSKAVGTLMVKPNSGIKSLGDLKGKRIGVAGGPLDKSWLILQAYALKEFGIPLSLLCEPVFAAPPLLNEELARGRIDAVLTYWHYAARLGTSEATPLLTVADMMRHLGIGSDVPMLGYAFREEWGTREVKALEEFLAASREAKTLLSSSTDAWIRLAPQIGTDDPAVLAALQVGFRAGLPGRWSQADWQAAVGLYDILVKLGGEKLVGRARNLDPKTFWPSMSN